MRVTSQTTPTCSGDAQSSLTATRLDGHGVVDLPRAVTSTPRPHLVRGCRPPESNYPKTSQADRQDRDHCLPGSRETRYRATPIARCRSMPVAAILPMLLC